jgi:hypothetical protein
VVFTQACRTKIDDVLHSFRQAIACCLGQVIVFLLVYLYQTLSEHFRHGIAVAHDGIALRPVTGCPVAAYHEGSLMQKPQRLFGSREHARGEYRISSNSDDYCSPEEAVLVEIS